MRIDRDLQGCRVGKQVHTKAVVEKLPNTASAESSTTTSTLESDVTQGEKLLTGPSKLSTPWSSQPQGPGYVEAMPRFLDP